MSQAQKIADSLSMLEEPILDEHANHCPSGYEMHFYCKYKAGYNHDSNNNSPFIPVNVENQSAAIKKLPD